MVNTKIEIFLKEERKEELSIREGDRRELGKVRRSVGRGKGTWVEEKPSTGGR